MTAYRKYFINAICTNYPVQAAAIIAATDNHYSHICGDTKFSFTSKNPIDRRLDFSAYFLALIKALDIMGEPFEMIRKVCLEVVTDYVAPKNKLQAALKRLPPKLVHTWLGQKLVKSFGKRVNHNANADGFVANIITGKAETFGLGYGVDIMECGICKLFQKHNYGKYASILCEVDEITSGMAGLQLIRTGTIANGAKKCDFRFKKL